MANMFEWDGQERTERPTQARLEEARRQGRVPRSLDLTVALSLIGAFSAVYLLGPRMLETSREGLTSILGRLSRAGESLGVEEVGGLVAECATWFLAVVVPVGIGTAAVIAIAFGVQLGSGLVPRAPVCDLGRLSPGRGLARIFSLRSVARGGFVSLKLLGAGALGLAALLSGIGAGRPALASGGLIGLRETLSAASGAIARVGLEISLVLLALGLADLLYQRWQHGRDLRMSRSEVEEETIRLEGNREQKSRIRKEARSRMGSSRASASARPGSEGETA